MERSINSLPSVKIMFRDGPIFHENICGHKSETMGCMELKIDMNEKHHRYYKNTKFQQNPRGDPKFLVDMTWNDPGATTTHEGYYITYIPVV